MSETCEPMVGYARLANPPYALVKVTRLSLISCVC
jgi:hypothetical protein